MALKTYDAVIQHLVKEKRTHHLMIGNGFSMAYDPEIFSYNALHKFFEEIEDELLLKLFEIIKTKNFELVMQQLGNFCELIEAFGTDKELLKKVSAATEYLKKSLLAAIEKLHPEHVFKIPEQESQQCATFLATYLDNGGSLFSTNYDILLYWVLMRNKFVKHVDGFGRDRLNEDEPEEEPVYSDLRWGNNIGDQNVYYLHGALPLFDVGVEILKEVYDGNYLMENIKSRLDKGEYPIFVAAGNGQEKLNHIMHNRYLSFCYDALCNIEGSLITFGFGFGDYDDHIIDAINKAFKGKKGDRFKKLWSVYVGVYSEADQKHIESLIEAKKFKGKVTLFDAKTVKIWR